MLQPRQSQQLFNAGQYTELCSYWNNGEAHDTLVAWDYYYLIRSFYNLKEYDSCLDVYDELHCRFPETHLSDFYTGWAIYYYIKSFNSQNLTPVITRLNQLITFEKTDKSAHKKAILAACKKLASSSLPIQGQPNNWQLVYDYLSIIPEGELSTDSFEKQEGNKTVECPSELESWYNNRAKALQILGRWQECIECIDEGLDKIENFHSKLDLWMKYRKAECLVNLNRAEEAEKILFSLEAPLQGWQIEAAIFRAERDLKCFDEAKRHAAKCALSDMHHSFRVNFYPEVALFLEDLGLAEEAQMHWQLTRLLRQKEGWSIKGEESKRPISPEITAMTEADLLRKLKKFWTLSLYPEPIRKAQIIFKKNDFSGLIKTLQDPIQKYEFQLDKRDQERINPKLGQRCRFALVKTYNKRHDTLTVVPKIISVDEE